jgi:protein SCO1/2
MRKERPPRPRGSRPGGGLRGAGLALLGLLLASLYAEAQVPQPPAPRSVAERVGIDQKLSEPLPLELTFRDESGRPAPLGSWFGRRPVVLALVYYRCPLLCNLSMNGMLAAFKTLNLRMGTDYQVLLVSIDPRETPELAAQKKSSYLSRYRRPGGEEGWRFLTGEEEAIGRLARACGFRYFYDAKSGQFAHATAIMVATPDGKLSRYLYGLEYSARDLQLALVEASSGKIGSLTDRITLFCYQYDPTTGRYGLAVMTSLRIGAVATLLSIAGFILVSVRREKRRRATP